MDTNSSSKLTSAQAFADDLSELSRKHGIGISGKPVLFLMEREDHYRRYKIDEESNLLFE